MLTKTREGNKKVPLSRCSSPKSGWEAIKLSTRGSELISKAIGIKNARSKYGEPSRLYQMECDANMRNIFEINKGKNCNIVSILC